MYIGPCSKKAIEGELHKLRGHYTQVNEERSQLTRAVDEKDKEIKDLLDQQSKTVQEHSDTVELIRNQTRQYARDYEEERSARERFAQQMMKLQEAFRQKDEEMDNLQGELINYTKDKEIKDLVDQQSKTIQQHSNTIKLMRNQIEQYARDYEEE